MTDVLSTISRIRTALAASRWGDVLAFAAFAMMAIGWIEAPWIARAMPSARAVAASPSNPSVSPLRASIAIAKENHNGD